MSDFIEPIEITELPKLKKRKRNSHKGDYGRVLIVGCSATMIGAGMLTGLAALRSGAGLVTLGLPEVLNLAVQGKIMELMTLPLPETIQHTICRAADHRIVEFSKNMNVVAIGPGMGAMTDTQDLVLDLLCDISCPVVLDADGLNALARDIDILEARPGKTIITPHPGEMANLIGKTTTYVQRNRIEVAVNFANYHNIIVVLKGDKTIVTDGEYIYINKTGNPGMATAGSGDVLTGVISAMIAQGLNLFDAAQLGVHVHGQAGDIAANCLGEVSLIATDIIEHLPDAFIE